MSLDHRIVARWLAYPAVLGGSLLWAYVLLERGGDATMVVSGIILAATLVGFALQRLMPYEHDWQDWGGILGLDFLHAMISSYAMPAGFRALAFGALFTGADALSSSVGMHLWPVSLPLGLQFVFALIVGEFGNYWVHRLMHETEIGWRFHAVHHTSDRLYMFSSARSHPLNVLVVYISQTVPLIVLGAPPIILALITLFTSVNGMMQHANIDTRVGPFNYLISTADVHRFHHSTVMDESNTNYGGNLMVWDVFFGTRYLPEHRLGPDQVGILDMSMRDNFLVHLIAPFAWQRVVKVRVPANQPQQGQQRLPGQGDGIH